MNELHNYVISYLSDWWKNVFSLYRSTGMRRSESIHGYLDGEFLIVLAEHTKGNKEYEIHLQPWQIDIVKKMFETQFIIELEVFKRVLSDNTLYQIDRMQFRYDLPQNNKELLWFRQS